MSGVDGGQSHNGPPLELMHLAAAGNTVVGDKYGLFYCFLFFFIFLVRLVRDGAWGSGVYGFGGGAGGV